MRSILLACTVLFTSFASYGADCVVLVTRYACPGKEGESYAKCGGRQSCEATASFTTAAECAALALSTCTNTRFDITKYKVVRAKFNGSDLGGGIDFCNQDSGSYKVSEHFPYRNSATCAR